MGVGLLADLASRTATSAGQAPWRAGERLAHAGPGNRFALTCMGAGSSKSDQGTEGGRRLRKTRSWGLLTAKEGKSKAEESSNPAASLKMSDEKEGKILSDVRARRASLAQDALQNKSVDAAGLAQLIAQDAAASVSDGDQTGAASRRGPEVILSGGNSKPSGDIESTPANIAAETDNMSVERTPFADYQGRCANEKWSVMDSDMQEMGAIDVLRADGYKLSVADVSVNQKMKTIAVASKTGEAHTISIKTGHEAQIIGSGPVRLPLTSIATNSDSTMHATGAMDKVLRIYDAKSGRELGSSGAHQSFVTCVAFANRNPRLLASGGGDKPIIRVWLAEEQDPKVKERSLNLLERCVLVGHWAFLSCVAFSGDDNFLASCSMDWTLRIWDIANGEPMVNMSFSAALVQDRTCMQVSRLQHITHRQMEEELTSDGSDVRFCWERPDFDEPLRLCRIPDTDGWGR